LISGDDCAIAGEATAAAAAPVAADTFKKSRRFIQTLLSGRFPRIHWSIFNGEANSLQPTTLWRGRSNTDVRLRKRNRLNDGAN
jgi:hypothetical protein